MKKFIALLVTMCLAVFPLTGCGHQSTNLELNKPFAVKTEQGNYEFTITDVSQTKDGENDYVSLSLSAKNKSFSTGLKLDADANAFKVLDPDGNELEVNRWRGEAIPELSVGGEGNGKLFFKLVNDCEHVDVVFNRMFKDMAQGRFSINKEEAVMESTSNQDRENNSQSLNEQEITDIIADNNFTADPEDYPADIFGNRVATGDFGTALWKLNRELEDNGKGQGVIALYDEEKDSLGIHFSPSDQAVEENDYISIATEYTAMAKMIISSVNKYSDIPSDSLTIVLGRGSALIVMVNYEGYAYTQLTTMTGNEELDQAIRIAYDVSFEDTAIDDWLD